MKARTRNPVQPLAYGIEEAAEALDIGISKMYGLIREGQVPIVKIGHRTLVRVSDLEVLLERNRVAKDEEFLNVVGL